jgi:hypothetical protein
MAFATVAELANFSDQDAQLALDMASAVVENVAKTVGATIAELADEERTIDGPGTDVLTLPTWPVTAVDTVEIDGDPVTGFNWSRNGLLQRTRGVWPEGRRNIKVVATYGFADDDVPEEIKAVTLQVALEARTNPSSLNSFSDGQVSAGFGGGGVGAEVLVPTARQREIIIRAIR